MGRFTWHGLTRWFWETAPRLVFHHSAASLVDPQNGVIEVSPEGFTLHRHGVLLADVKWDAVVEIVAYKADLFAYDMICWEVTFDPGPKAFEVTEHMVGFEALQKAAEARFAIPESWWSIVAFPAFVPNPTILWRRGEGPIVRAIPPPRG
jgi:hypothetical protein